MSSSLPIGTLIENPAELPDPRPALMKRMCCERLRSGEPCALVLGWVVCVPEMAGEISHGICEPCALRWLEALDGPAAVMAAEYTLQLGARQSRAAAGAETETNSR
jgi:hypothetical protein